MPEAASSPWWTESPITDEGAGVSMAAKVGVELPDVNDISSCVTSGDITRCLLAAVRVTVDVGILLNCGFGSE